MDDQQLDILYIAGAGRAGSTLFADVLGSLPGTLHIGELRGVFDYTIVSNGTMPCSCGRSFAECEFWAAVFESLYGSNWPETFRSLSLEGQVPNSHRIPWLMLRAHLQGKSPVNDHLQSAAREIERILLAVRRQTHSSIIVDSSKSGAFAWLLAQRVKPHLVAVHFIRDPRASTYSWIKHAIPIPVRGSFRAEVRTRGMSEGMLDWFRANGSAWLLQLYRIPYLRLKYEDFVADPAGCVQQVIAFAGKHGMSINADDHVRSQLQVKLAPLGSRHLIGSNPGVKSKVGATPITEDTTWLKNTPLLQRLLWAIVFLPWLLWLRYPLWPVHHQKVDAQQPRFSQDNK